MSARARAAVLIVPLAASGCSYQHYQSTFGNAATEARQFNTLFVIFLVVCAIMYVAVIAFMIGSIVRRRRAATANTVEEGRHHQSDPLMRTGLIAWGAVVGSGLVLLAIASFIADRSMASAAANEKLSITVTGNQWWWDVVYNAADNSKMVRTANEIHLPVGVPAHIYLKSNDVIHSFWVPSLAGKQDLIPGRENDISITPRQIGIYRGQCAEFCGAQHAKMALVVNVDSLSRLHQMVAASAAARAHSGDTARQGGLCVRHSRNCSACHAIAGTPASATFGPDLTHLASRRTIAAGAMPMGEGNLYGWVADPQSIKPGSKMPTIGLEPDQLHAVVAYLETLK